MAKNCCAWEILSISDELAGIGDIWECPRCGLMYVYVRDGAAHIWALFLGQRVKDAQKGSV